MAREVLIQTRLESYKSLDELPERLSSLVRQSMASAEMAYSPYSNRKVGAAVLLQDGQTVQGNNQENAAYPSGLCAERVAFFSAGSQSSSPVIDSVAVVSYMEGTGKKMISAFPCGACRQVMIEYENRQQKPIQVVMSGGDGNFLIAKAVKDLLPLAFTDVIP